MKQKPILVSFIALFAIILAINVVSAGIVDIQEVEVNNIVLAADDLNPIAGEVSDTISIEVEFDATLSGILTEEELDDNEGLEDVKVEVEIKGYRDEISDSTSRFLIYDGRTYIKRFSLKLPSSFDLDENPEELEIVVTISAKGQSANEVRQFYPVTIQRVNYNLDLLSIEAPDTVTAGSVIAIDVVLKNTGYDRLDDTYVKVSIPGVVERTVYFGDIASDIDVDYDQIRDTINKRIYLSIPSDAISGIYNLEVEAYNYDSDVMAKKQIVLSGIEADEDVEDSDDDVEVIDGDETETSNTVLILTVILAIIFVVLLIILIVLLTKKPSEIEELGEDETSYY